MSLPSPRKIATAYAALANARVGYGSACSPTSLAFAWVSPSGRLIELPGMQTHKAWALKNMAKYPSVLSLVEDEGYDASEAFLKLGWVRFVNARHIDVWSLPTLRARKVAHTVCSVLVECAIPGTDAEEALVWVSLVRSGGASKKFSLADFMGQYATSAQESAFYERLGV